MSNLYRQKSNINQLSIEAYGLLKILLADENSNGRSLDELCRMRKNDSADTVRNALYELTAKKNKYIICKNGRYFVNEQKIAELKNI